jgi:hypothetical protein
MQDKEITVPKALHELHGDKTRLSTLVLVYLSGVIAAGLVLILLLPNELPLWKMMLIAVLYVDIAGGVVANLSTSTNQYYQDRNQQRTIFALLHILQPAIFILVFPAAWLYYVFSGLYTLMSIGIVSQFQDSELQQNAAALLVVVGVALSFAFPVPHAILYSFAPLFLLKLVLGFAVRRPSFYPD